MDRAKRVQNQNKCLFVEFRDLHHAPMRLIHVALHLAKCKFVVHWMERYHVEIRMANDVVRSNKIHATTADKSIGVLRDNRLVLHSENIKINGLPFLDRFVLLAAAFPQQSLTQRRPFFYCHFYFFEIKLL